MSKNTNIDAVADTTAAEEKLDNLAGVLTTAEVAEKLGIRPQSVNSTMRRAGIGHGWDRAAVEALQRPGQGSRTDLVRREA